jgi:N-acetylmuramoyl-L-alanine amidase
MEGLDVTKLRLVREAIQHNLQSPRRTRTKAATRRTLDIPVCMAGAFLIASLVYLSLPSTLVSRVGVASASTPGVTPSESPPAGDPARLSRSLPRRVGRAVLPLSVKKIVLDPGHGGTQLGATSDSGVSEKEITLDIALRLRRLLSDAAFEVLMTRETDTTVSLEQRVAFANGERADLFVSIHVNWIPRREIRPLETYHVGPTDDPATLRLATLENRDSGYPLAAYRRLLEKIYMDTRRDESTTLARTINAELYRAMRDVNPRLENRGVKMAPFAVLVGTEMPAILVEVSCLSNEEDVSLLTKADYRETIAAAMLRGLRSYASELDGAGRRKG